MRINRETMFMEIAQIVAKRATCFRLNVGAVITFDNRIISIGYNGRPAGEPHCQGHDCPGRFRCTETIHAEDNAIRHIPGPAVYNGLDLYVTDSPCQSCAKKIIEGRHTFERVFFRTPYRLTEGLDDLCEANIPTYQVLPSGVIMNWATKEFMNA